MKIFNLRDKIEFIEEVATLEQKEWGNYSNKNVKEKINNIKEKFKNKYFEKLLLIDNEELIGFVSIFEYDIDERKDLKPWYATMYVKEKYRGKGYSKILNDAVLKKAKEKNIKRIYLKTELENYYEKFGAKFLKKYKFAEDDYLLVVNASNRHKDFDHIKANILPGTVAEDISDSLAQIALQGPKAKEIMVKLVEEEKLPAKYYTAERHVEIDGVDCLVSRTGYTGEFGYEIYIPKDEAEHIWKVLREAGEEFGLIPCGLGARDTLRLEAAMPLYGHEMTDEITPLEAGLDFGVKMNKPEFIGKAALEEKGEPKVVRVGLEVTGRGIIREHQDVYLGEEKIGYTTSGTHCPFIGKAVAMAMVPRENSEVGTKVNVDVRGRMVEAEIVPLPFYKKA